MEQGKRRNQSGGRCYISEELVVEEILVRLPVKSVLRFKCVSKTWRSHIHSRWFIDLYRHHPSRGAYQRFNLFSPYASCLKLFSKAPRLTKLSPGPPDLLLPRKLMLLKRPRYDPEWKRVVRVLGPTPNGIYCSVASLHKESTRCVSIATAKIALCNPATHDYRFTSHFPRDSYSLVSDLACRRCRVHYGFGCVPVGDQFHYKVIIIISWGAWFSSFLSFVYSLQHDEWTKIADYQHGRDPSERKAPQGLVMQQGKVQYPEITQDVELCPRSFFNGCWHWLAVQPDGTYSVLAFDFSDDAFKVMGAPGGDEYFHHFDNGSNGYVNAGGMLVLNDHLSAICFDTPCYRFDVWMMMDYGVADSWTRVYTVHPGGLLAHNFSRIVGFFFWSPNNKNKILQILFVAASKVMVWCSDYGRVGVGPWVDFSEFICWNTVGISAYRESLEPLPCPNTDDGQHHC